MKEEISPTIKKILKEHENIDKDIALSIFKVITFLKKVETNPDSVDENEFSMETKNGKIIKY